VGVSIVRRVVPSPPLPYSPSSAPPSPVPATGHSVRGVYRMLYDCAGEAAVEAKGFAVGFRVEHPQEFINQAQLGKWAAEARAAAL